MTTLLKRLIETDRHFKPIKLSAFMLLYKTPSIDVEFPYLLHTTAYRSWFHSEPLTKKDALDIACFLEFIGQWHHQ